MDPWLLFLGIREHATTSAVYKVGHVPLKVKSLFPTYTRLSNYKQRSLYGFRMSTMIGWVGGDSFK